MPFPSDRPPPTGPPAAILGDLWDRLEEAAARGKPAFHLPTLATVAADGSPAARVVVLRHADRNAGVVGCHADARSPKVREIVANPAAAWVFYDRPGKLQARVTGRTEVIADGPAFDAAWAATTPSARRCYLGPFAPGAAADGPEPNVPPAFAGRDPTDAESRPGRANFRLLRTTARAIDWLHLAHDGHRRARFTRDDAGGAWTGGWVAV